MIGKFLDDHNGAIIALFTITLATYTFKLSKATDKLVVGAELASERQLRAYVVATIMDGARELSETTPYVVFYCIRNVGQTPANTIEFARAVDIFQHPLPTRLNLPTPTDVGARGVVIGPGISFDRSIQTAHRCFTRQEIQEIQGEDASFRIYFYGWIIYEDAFKKRRKTEFCLSHVWKSATTDQQGGIHVTWDVTEGRNYYD